jgi:hypothetical protein
MTSKDPNRRVRKATERTSTGRPAKRCAMSARHTTSAAAPSLGEQNMYCVSGWFSMRASRTSCSVTASRRQAFGLALPLRKAFAATLASVAVEIAWSCM